MDDVCKCDVPLKPLSEWVSEEDEETCRPCQVPEIMEDYKRALIDAGLGEVVEEMDIDSDTTPEEVCQLLDNLVQASDPELRCELEQINCKYQSQSNPDDVPEEEFEEDVEEEPEIDESEAD